jgi:uncharacterized membrane protein (UPF0182 family)
MTPGRRLLAGLIAAAAVLLLGRALALVYTDYAWFVTIGAPALWVERVRDLTIIHTVSAVLAGLFALVNLYSIRLSIVSLAFPRRLGNVEFGEAVPTRYLDRAAIMVSVAVALFLATVAPKWQQLALLDTGVRFGESDPFFQLDLSFYVAWLPLETAVYDWCLVLLVTVAAIVIALYALTPSLRWENGAFHLSAHVRRHLAMLSSLLLLLMAWTYRLDGYRLLVHGTGVNGAFTYLDHQWLLPAYLALSVVTLAAAVLVFVSGWTGQIKTMFYTVTTVLVVTVAVDLVLPPLAHRFAMSNPDVEHQQPYASTRAAFTKRAYGDSAGVTATPRELGRFDSFGDSARVTALVDSERDHIVVYPGARGAAIVTHGPSTPAPELGSGLTRLAQAWAEQRLDLVWGPFPPEAKIARRRDVRERVGLLALIFTEGTKVSPAFLGDTLMWIVELYSASSYYPLSAHYIVGGTDQSYFRHAGSALVNSRTGRMMIVPAENPDPIAVAWRAKFPGLFRPGRPDIFDALTANPTGLTGRGAPSASSAASADIAFRREVSRLYERMRESLEAGDLQAFGAAYDSLGEVIRRD